MYRLKLPLLLALSTCLILACCANKPVIRKCCPQDQRLIFTDKGMECRGLDAEESRRFGGEFWWWLPRDAMKQDAAALLDERRVGYGQPACDHSSMDVLLYESASETDFKFHARKGEIRLEVLSSSSFHDDYALRNDSFTPGVYCVDRLDMPQGASHVTVLCPCLVNTCVRLCCMDFSVYNRLGGGMCVPVPDDNLVMGREITPWTPTVERKTDYYRLTNRTPMCSLTFHEIQDSRNGSQLKVMDDGSIKTLDGSNEHIPRDEYCTTFDVNHRELILFCMKKSVEWFWKRIIYGVMFLIGAFCLLLTVIVTLILPEMRRNIHGKMAIAHNFMLFMGHLVTGISQLRGSTASRASCEAMSVVIQFSTLAAFFWLNVMCIDISWTFSGLRPIQGTAMQRDRKKFIYYSLYAWGSTALISMATLIVEYSPSVTRFKPNFGAQMCFFNDGGAEFLFFFGPMALLLGVNLVLFAYTAYKIVAVKRETSILSTGDSATTSTKNKQTLILYVKLFCLMGVTWVTEIISWAVGGPSYMWYFTDFINLLRAVFIFVIFCCKKNVYVMLRNRVRQWLGREPLHRSASKNARSCHSNNSSCTRTTAATTSTTPNARRKFSTQSQDKRTEEIEMSRIPLKSKDNMHDSVL